MPPGGDAGMTAGWRRYGVFTAWSIYDGLMTVGGGGALISSTACGGGGPRVAWWRGEQRRGGLVACTRFHPSARQIAPAVDDWPGADTVGFASTRPDRAALSSAASGRP